MPPFRDEHILIIAPGSQTTLAQLGLPESFTPAAYRFPTRMFPAPDGKTYEPYKVKVQTRKKEDVEMKEGDGEGGEGDEEDEIVELPEDEEGAVFPLKEGRIADMPAFFAFLQHIHTTLQPTLHTPIMLIAQPSWTAKNHEDLTAFIFEKFKTPALCIMDSALATSYAFGIANATIVDVGYEKVDVTAITDYQIGGRGTVPSSGGNGMTKRLVELLKSKDFTHDMAEQLKKSPICEVLAPGVPMPGTEVAEEVISNPAAAASTGATASGPTVKITEAPRGPGPDTEVGEEGGDVDDVDVDKAMEDDGVLDIATIVTSGKTQDFLAKKEKEKAERAAIRKATKEREAAEAAAARPLRLPNSKRPRAMFHYEELIKEPAAKRQKTPEPASAIPAEDPAPVESKPDEEPTSAIEAPTAGDGQKKSNRRKLWEEENPDRSRRDIEIGLERFLAADPAYLDRIADTIYRTILSVDDISKRQDAWDALVICGCGSKVRGFKDALLQTLNHRYLVSPSSATMFMSELPSNLATPSGTGSMTPTASFSSTPHAPPTANAVNPLLLAATTASNPALNPGLQASASYAGSVHQHSSHSQSPTSIKIASPPTYFSEWKQYEEAVFLGSQVAAKVIFVVDQGLSKGFLSRTEFNEDGPGGIHQV
ncbi:SWI/SNF and RSC complexes subunit arp9 [Lachnellula arida]|uniref:SWI/SNF and RSC complexes subunit arp9 n=1 Tax=Lachnellula arida TaxID=1316785 RepID=A0A8T9BHC8_9HELO|nr:SWI/SNF and RSC complexes subunit arp9 [Lachnellula arida]